MNMNRFKSGFYWAVLATEASHIFCCVLPTIASVTGLLVSLGLIGSMPGFIETTHNVIHAYELPIIIIAGIVLAAGWVFQYVSDRIDCHNTGCAHGACGGRKRSSKRVLYIASALFLFNISIYFFVHTRQDLNTATPGLPASVTSSHGDHQHE